MRRHGPDGEPLYSRARFHDTTHELVAHDRAMVETTLATEVRVQVGATDAGGLDLHDHIVVVAQDGIRYSAVLE